MMNIEIVKGISRAFDRRSVAVGEGLLLGQQHRHDIMAACLPDRSIVNTS